MYFINDIEMAEVQRKGNSKSRIMEGSNGNREQGSTDGVKQLDDSMFAADGHHTAKNILIYSGIIMLDYMST